MGRGRNGAEELGSGLAGGFAAGRGEARGEEFVLDRLGGEVGEGGDGCGLGLGGDEAGAVLGQAGEGSEPLACARVVEVGDQVVDRDPVVGGEGGQADVGGEVVGEEGVGVGGAGREVVRSVGRGGRRGTAALRVSRGAIVVQERANAVVWFEHDPRYGAGWAASATEQARPTMWRARGEGRSKEGLGRLTCDCDGGLR